MARLFRPGERVWVALVIDKEESAILQIQNFRNVNWSPQSTAILVEERYALFVNKPCALLIGTSAFKASFSKKSYSSP